MADEEKKEKKVVPSVSKTEEKAAEKSSAPSKKAAKKSKGESVKTEEFIEQIKNMSVIELSELVKALEETFGVSAAAPVAVAAPGAAPAAAGGEEKTSFDVVLASFGAEKIKVIKEVRTITGLGLKEAKALVDAAPKAVKEGVSKEEAEKIESALKEAGATVEVK